MQQMRLTPKSRSSQHYMAANVDLSQSTPDESGFLLRLWGAVAVVNLLLSILIAILVWQGRHAADNEAALLAVNYSRILEENVVGFFGKIDVTLRTVGDEVMRQRARGRINAHELNAFLDRQNQHIPEALGLRVVDANGDIRYAVGGVKIAAANIADRPWFQQLKADANAGLVISKPVVGRLAAQPIITISRRLNHPDGSFAGDIHVAVALTRFIVMFSRLDLSNEGTVGLWDKEGTLIVRYTKADKTGQTAGATTPSPALKELLDSGKRETIYRAESGIDKVLRVFAFRKMDELPLYLVVGLADKDYLATWRSDSMRTAGVGALFVIATLVLAWMVQVAWKRNLAARRALLERTREVEAAKRQGELILASVGEGICGVDRDAKVVFVNPAARKMFGWGDDEVIGQDLHALVHHHYPDGAPFAHADCALVKTIQDGQWRQVSDECYWRKDGTSFAVEYTVAPIMDGEAVAGAVNIFQDITGRKKNETALREAMVQAESSNFAKSRFLATMSHELRTPMNGILGMAQMLLMDNIEDAERQDYARTILNSGQTLLTLLNDILDLSKIEAGKLELEHTAIDPEQILHETANLFRENAGDKGLKLEVQWEGTAQRYLADQHRLRQMLSNLTNNAIKFSTQGMVRLQAKEIERLDGNALLEFSVCDTGIGVAEDKLEVLFKPFSQADGSITRQYGGTGLGLSIVRSLAMQMGGDVGVESTPGQGSRFWFRIRAGLVNEGIDRRSLVRTHGVATVSPEELKGNILIVEDNATNQKVMQAMLKKLGLDCQIAADGHAGAEAVRQDPAIDVVLMDVQMPVMDGYESTRRIRAWEADAQQRRRPIIALTADAFAEDRQHCLDAGMDDFLSKPVSLDKLLLALQRWLPTANT